MSRRDLRPAAVVLAVTAASGAGLLGCGGGDREVKASKVEEVLARQQAAQGVRLRDVSCKSGVDAKPGRTVPCTGVSPASTTIDYEAKVTAVDGDRASFVIRSVKGTAKGEVIAADVRSRLQRQQRQATRSVTCPDEVVLPTPKPITCTTTTPDGKRYDTTVAVDAAHRITYRVARRPQR